MLARAARVGEAVAARGGGALARGAEESPPDWERGGGVSLLDGEESWAGRTFLLTQRLSSAS